MYVVMYSFKMHEGAHLNETMTRVCECPLTPESGQQELLALQHGPESTREHARS